VGPLGICIDLNKIEELLELKYIIRKIASQEKIEVSRDILNQTCSWILEKKANLKLKLKDVDLCVDRGFFFVLKKKYLPFDHILPLSLKKCDINSFEISVKKSTLSETHIQASSWIDLFKGESILYLPQNKYYMSFFKGNKKLKKNWGNYKVPAFLRNMFPVVYDDDNNVYDFLSGNHVNLNNLEILQINLKLK
ncbi:MAG: tRNA lysidine(34) synthetase TilS, partial [Parachlamydiales bacterium]